jgi:hypothetical protein
MPDMPNFVNREDELQLIAQQLDLLTEKNNLIRTQIIEFYGVGGIGKTTILRKIEQNCQDRHLPAIWIDASQNMPDFPRKIIDQVQRYNVQFIRIEGNDWLNQSIIATRALLQKGPVIFLIDSLDADDEEQLNQIGHMLVDLTRDDKLFTILASKRKVSFDSILPIARKLTPPVQLKSFDRESYIAFLNGLEQHIDSEIRDIIFEWTGGYPLAINVMVQAILDYHLDPRLENDKRQLLSIIVEQVINRGVLANASQTPDKLAWFQTMLGLFSIPRRCNLSVMQRMIERFAPDYKLGSSLAYMSLPKRINPTADVLNWDASKAGFSVEPPIRHIFLMRLKIEDPDRYAAIHNFLATTNRRLADEVNGIDRTRYLQEYLYHSASCEEGTVLKQIVEKTVQQIIAEPPEYFLLFHEDFLSDEELKTALGPLCDTVLSLTYRHLAMINKQIAAESTEVERIFYLRDFFYYIILDPAVTDFRLHLSDTIQQVVKEQPAGICARLHEELLRDTRIKERCGEDITILSSLLNPSSQ